MSSRLKSVVSWVVGLGLVATVASNLSIHSGEGPKAGAALDAAAQPADAAGFVIVRPEEIRWQTSPNAPGLQTAAIQGDPSKPGLYVLRVKL